MKRYVLLAAPAVPSIGDVQMVRDIEGNALGVLRMCQATVKLISIVIPEDSNKRATDDRSA